MMGGDGGMRRRHAAVAVGVAESGEDGSSPFFPDVQADRGSRGREAINEKGNSESGNVALQTHQPSAFLSFSCLVLH